MISSSNKIPTGVVTFLFTDIEGSTRLSQEYPDTIQLALEKHHSILQDAINSNHGFVFLTVGDAICCAFENTDDAVRSAVEIQTNLANEKWDDAEIRIRIGIHSGKAEWNGKDYMGYITLARAARVMSAAYGGQILVSGDACEYAKEKNQKNISFRDLGQRRLKDLKQPVKLYQVVAEGLREDFPPLNTLDARPNNLPVQLTSFIGREAEMKQVKNLLRQTHLLTLTGTGGSGKTRISLQVGADVIDSYANGVWFVELAALTEPALLANTIVKTLSVLEQPKITVEELLINYLNDKEMLLIFDNCEHLIEAVADLTHKMLMKSPGLRIIATSREALRCEGEQTHRVLPLECPDPNDNESPEKLSRYESVRLFIETALAVNQNFRLNNDNAPALAKICFQLDGIPLAIELAAARTNALSVEQIYQRLDDRFRLLTGGKRTSLPRQQTLKALIDWSYELLTENERLMWQRLSVFTGGWTLEAAETICPDEKISKNEILNLLTGLTEKSIIVYDESRDRYRMLETIKQYGKEKLSDENDIFLKHLSYFTELSEKAMPELQKENLKFWLDILEADHSNLVAAIDWSLHNKNAEKGARVAAALGEFWDTMGHYSTGIRIIESIMESTDTPDRLLISRILYWIGIYEMSQGHNEQARKYADRSLDLGKDIGDKRAIANGMNILGQIESKKGNYEHAKMYYKENLAIIKEIGDKNGFAHSLRNLGNEAYNKGEYDQAKIYYKESLAISKEHGNKRSIAASEFNLGNIANNQGDFEQAKQHFEESLAIGKEIGIRFLIAKSMNHLANVLTNQGDYKQAVKYHQESLNLYEEIGIKDGIALSMIHLGDVLCLQGECERAEKYLSRSMTLYREIGDRRGIANSTYFMGNLYFNQEKYEQAKNLYKESLSICNGINYKLGVADIMNSLGILSYIQGRYELSVKLLSASEKILESMGSILVLGEQLKKDETIKKLHEQLSDEDFNKYWEEGKNLTPQEACKMAIDS